jgi:hypothetical protein
MQYTSCWQGYFYHWRILISGLESTQYCALPWATHQLLTGLFVPWGHSYFVFIRHTILCITCNIYRLLAGTFVLLDILSLSTLSVSDWDISVAGYAFLFMLRTKKVLFIPFRKTPVVDRIIANTGYSFLRVWTVQNLLQCLGNLHLLTGLLCLLSSLCVSLAYIHTYKQT